MLDMMLAYWWKRIQREVCVAAEAAVDPITLVVCLHCSVLRIDHLATVQIHP